MTVQHSEVWVWNVKLLNAVAWFAVAQNLCIEIGDGAGLIG